MVIFRFPLTPSPPKKRFVLDNAVSKLILTLVDRMVFIPSTKINVVDQKSSKFKKAPPPPPPPEISKSTPCFLSQNKKLDFGKTDFNQESGNKKKFQENLIL